MTRINVVPVTELCDQHLLAEFRELTRIPNCIASGRAKIVPAKIPAAYTLGTGHVTFFYDKLVWLKKRYDQLTDECDARGFNVTYKWPTDLDPSLLGSDWKPTPEAFVINRARIADRLANMRPRWTARKQDTSCTTQVVGGF